jgi:hypothetical protein
MAGRRGRNIYDHDGGKVAGSSGRGIRYDGMLKFCCRLDNLRRRRISRSVVFYASRSIVCCLSVVVLSPPVIPSPLVIDCREWSLSAATGHCLPRPVFFCTDHWLPRPVVLGFTRSPQFTRPHRLAHCSPLVVYVDVDHPMLRVSTAPGSSRQEETLELFQRSSH